MSGIAFARLGPDDRARVAHLVLGPGQDAFTANPVDRLGMLAPGEEAWAVLDGPDVVGFFVLDRHFSRSNPFAGAQEIGLRSLLIDASLQGRGLGRAVMEALPGLVERDYPGTTGVVLTVNARNPGARTAYLRAGFIDTGEIYLGGGSGPQHVMRLRIGA